MNKILIMLLVVIVGGTFTYNHYSTSRANLALQNSSLITSSSPVYSTVDVKFSEGSRDVTTKLVFEFPSLARCESESKNKEGYLKNYESRCEQDSACQSVNMSSCAGFIDEKYKGMLNKQFSGTHFLHVSAKRTPDERGVIVFWGLNDDEAKSMCDYVDKRNTSEQMTSVCL